MRMKKLFALALVALLFVARQSFAQSFSVTVDDDVGVCYVIPSDQVQINMDYFTDTPSIILLGPGIYSTGVENPVNNYEVIINSPCTTIHLYTIENVTGITANSELPTRYRQNYWIEEGLRFGTGEVIPWVGVSA